MWSWERRGTAVLPRGPGMLLNLSGHALLIWLQCRPITMLPINIKRTCGEKDRLFGGDNSYSSSGSPHLEDADVWSKASGRGPQLLQHEGQRCPSEGSRAASLWLSALAQHRPGSSTSDLCFLRCPLCFWVCFLLHFRLASKISALDSPPYFAHPSHLPLPKSKSLLFLEGAKRPYKGLLWNRNPAMFLSLLPSARGHEELKHDSCVQRRDPALPALMTLIFPSEPLVG